MDTHVETVQAIANRIAHLHQAKTPFRVYHGSTNSTHKSQRNHQNIIDISSLKNVLSVNPRTKTAIVESNVSMDALVTATLAHNLVPLVVMEFPRITAGGGFSGTSGESSSFKYGFFDCTVNWVEIVLANGQIMTASKDNHPDLFWGAASAFGTLGVITSLEIDLKPAMNYVALTHYHLSSIDKATKLMLDKCQDERLDYIDGIVYGIDSVIISTGQLTDSLPAGTVPQRFSGSRDPWFYIHVDRVRKRLSKDDRSTVVDYIPLKDYLFRYNRGVFWVGKYAFQYFLTPFNRVTRFILDPLMQTHVMYRALHRSGMIDYYMVQDIAVPHDKVAEFVEWLHTEFGIYPLWLCPLRVSRQAENSEHGIHSAFGKPDAPLMINVGLWGPLSSDRRKAIARNRQLEKQVAILGGKKWLYAQGYYTEDEFWDIYDRKSYDALRIKYHAEHLPNVYNKVNVNLVKEAKATNASLLVILLNFFWSIWPFRGLYGLYHAIVTRTYLLKKRVGS